MEELILISYLNDFIFCPISIYFHKLYDNVEKNLYQGESQIMGSYSHKAIDIKKYSSKKDILQSIDVYCSKYNILGKIDTFDVKNGILTERKKKILKIYDGYVFQLYAQYFALVEMGYDVNKIRFHSMDDNKNYNIRLPNDDEAMLKKFEKLVEDINMFEPNSFEQENTEKCRKCIYEPACDRSRNVN